MIVVIGRPRDPLAQSLLERWLSRDAALLTARDLSHAGWRHDPFAPGAGQAVIGGRPVRVAAIEGVVTTIASISGYDLPHIVREDRDYVAAEMRSFLMAWLTTVGCPVLNRPTPVSLTGCGWRPEQWRRAAAELGVPAVAVREPSAGAEATEAVATVTLVGDAVLDAPDDLVAGWVRRLAVAAGTSTLVARFVDGPPGDGPPLRLLSADALPDLTRPEVAAAALAWLERGGS